MTTQVFAKTHGQGPALHTEPSMTNVALETKRTSVYPGEASFSTVTTNGFKISFDPRSPSSQNNLPVTSTAN
jgi:hypothetical protein